MLGKSANTSLYIRWVHFDSHVTNPNKHNLFICCENINSKVNQFPGRKCSSACHPNMHETNKFQWNSQQNSAANCKLCSSCCCCSSVELCLTSSSPLPFSSSANALRHCTHTHTHTVNYTVEWVHPSLVCSVVWFSSPKTTNDDRPIQPNALDYVNSIKLIGLSYCKCSPHRHLLVGMILMESWDIGQRTLTTWARYYGTESSWRHQHPAIDVVRWRDDEDEMIENEIT